MNLHRTNVHTRFPMHLFVKSRQLGRGDARQDARQRFQNRHVHAMSAGDSGHFESNIAAAYYGEPEAGLELTPNANNIVDCPQVMKIRQAPGALCFMCQR